MFEIIKNFLNLFIKNEIFESKIMKNKIEIINSNNYIFSVSLLPYFNITSNDYLEFYKMIDYISNNTNNTNIYTNSKISIKIRQLAKTEKEQQNILENIIDYANKKNVFVWLSCVLFDDLDNEYNTYLKFLNKNYKNIGLTLATYNSSVNDKIDNILSLDGNIRLVKGYYYGDINDYNKINNLFYLSAFDDPSLVQFMHRNLAYVIVLFYLYMLYKIYKKKLNNLLPSIYLVGILILLQIVLGIFTLIYGAQIKFASMHQVSSIFLVSSSIYFLYINKTSNQQLSS